jgi:hypothetical protein
VEPQPAKGATGPFGTLPGAPTARADQVMLALGAARACPLDQTAAFRRRLSGESKREVAWQGSWIPVDGGGG